MEEIQSQNMKISGEDVVPRNRSSHGSFEEEEEEEEEELMSRS